MTQPSDETDLERLFELFDWAQRETVYRVRFIDGEEYELTGVGAAQDKGELPHATASVVRTLICRKAEQPQRNPMFFRLPEVTEVADADTGEILYQAV